MAFQLPVSLMFAVAPPAPDSAGTYEFYCPVQGHRAAGMEGKLVVN